jgi:two-component system capsular synthesis sensor histidine kinase RcsC
MSLHGVDWIAIHSYSFQAILAAKGASLLATIVVTFLILAALWTLLLRMERCVFEPALADASRVYESDALNRAIVQTSPIGLALLDRHTYRPVMQNGVASQIMMGNQEKLDAFYEAMCAESHGMDEGSR